MINIYDMSGHIEVIHREAHFQMREIAHCEIRTDKLSLGLYATDASLYQVKPLAVAIPQNEEALVALIKVAHKFQIPVMPRGSATSLAGQTTNRALIIDFTRYFDKILDINADQRWAVVQPGVTRDQLNAAISPYGLHFAPDPATSSRATIGGMIANNSSGTKSIKYGKTIDHLIELKVLLSDGLVIHIRETSPEDYDTISQKDDREGQIYREFRSIIFGHSQAIQDAFPKVMRRVQGYPLDEFVYTDTWNLAKIFAGSEGSLGIILEAKINLEPIPEFKASFTLHYHERMQAIREVKDIILFEPAAVEMLDYNVFVKSKSHPATQLIHHKLIQGEPQATLSVEFFNLSSSELQEKTDSFYAWLREHSQAYAYPLLKTKEDLEDSWTLRKNGLGLIMGHPDGRKPVPFIEDMAIDPQFLPDYVSEVLKLCHDKGVETILYAHASVGVLHIRPHLDMTKEKDILLMKEISDSVFQWVKKYNGSWSGEHGDGRNRGHKLKEFFGHEVYSCLERVKNIFDPSHLLNPGIIIDVPPMDEHLRYGPHYTDHKESFVYKYRKDYSFETLVHNCSGVGACRNLTSGTMCPSFRATREESDSTRGRANALRLALSRQMEFNDLTDPKVLDALDLCLSCKACKSECPSGVDMAKLKSEILQKKYDKGHITLREQLIFYNHRMSQVLSGVWAPVFNAVIKSSIFKKIAHSVLGIDQRRTLPSYTTETLSSWYKKNYTTKGLDKKVALFADTYINYHEPHIGKKAIRLLNDCGYEVELAEAGCCQRPKISNGFLKSAKEKGTELALQLKKHIDQNIKIVVCEPSCTSALLDDLPDLLEDESLGHMLKKHIVALDEFIAQELESGHIVAELSSMASSVFIHSHCHQKATFGHLGMEKVFSQMTSVSVQCPDTGCCGMAGSFGYEKDHFDISKKIADLQLVPTLKDLSKDTLIIANGFSCRHQINDFSGKKAVHWAESIRVTPKVSY